MLHASRATKRPRPAWVLDLHRSLAALACIFTIIHIGALVLDDFIGFGVRDLLVPNASKYKPTAVAWGVVAMYFLLAVQCTSLCMKFIPRRAWHTIHLASFLLFAMTTTHMMQAGTDRRSPYVRAAAALALTAVALATTGRVVARHVVRIRHDRRRMLLHAHVSLERQTLSEVDDAIEQLVRGGSVHAAEAVEADPRRADHPKP